MVARAGRTGEPGRQRRAHLLRGERLCHVIVHPRGETVLAVALDRARGQRDDWDMAIRRRLLLADRRGRLEPVHLGHLAIHENEAELAIGVALERLLAVGRGNHVAAETFQHADCDFEIDQIVLDEQDRCAGNAVRWRSDRLPRRIGAAFPRGKAGAQRRLADRPAQPADDQLADIIDFLDFLVTRGQQHQPQTGDCRVGLDLARQRGPVQIGQRAVDDRQPEWLIAGRRGGNRGACRHEVFRLADADTPNLELIRQVAATLRVGLDNQHRHPLVR